MAEAQPRIGLIAIGRNEGERLERCLRFVPSGIPTVYVDSGSSDGSVAFARLIGAEVVALDLTRPFTAARARNEGYERLREVAPTLDYVQFVDGDCELEDGWIEAAAAVLDAESELAAVCGRRRERYPEASFYNRLCDEEWNTPVGEAPACGGDAVLRVGAFEEVGGYDSAMVAREEPEMCHRLRTAGWRIRRIAAPMTIHDAAMHHPRQWWLRAIRSGFGYAQVWRATAGGGLPALYRCEIARALFWSLGEVALAAAAAALIGTEWLLLALTLWLLQAGRLAYRHGWRLGMHLLVGKFAEALGIFRFAITTLRGRRQGAIFYK